MIKLFLTDIDGCLTAGRRTPPDLGALTWIQEYNSRAQKEPGLAPITLCSGRAHPYVKAILHFIAGSLPAVCDNGCLLYFPLQDAIQMNPLLGPRQVDEFREIREVLSKAIRCKHGVSIEPGKELCLTLRAKTDTSFENIRLAIINELGERAKDVELTWSAGAVDITPAGINKASGAKFLSEATGIGLEAMVGIGDSPADAEFLKVVAYAAVPANASEEVKGLASYVSPYTYTEGVIDIIRHYMKIDRP